MNISFFGNQTLTEAGLSTIFNVASDTAANFVSTAVGTNMVTLSFGSTNTGQGGQGIGTYNIVGTNAAQITSVLTGFGANAGTWRFAEHLPNLQLIIPFGTNQMNLQPPHSGGFFMLLELQVSYGCF